MDGFRVSYRKVCSNRQEVEQSRVEDLRVVEGVLFQVQVVEGEEEVG